MGLLAIAQQTDPALTGEPRRQARVARFKELNRRDVGELRSLLVELGFRTSGKSRNDLAIDILDLEFPNAS